jgi:hypothetical protein
MDYPHLSIAEVAAALRDAARDVESTFGGLDSRQINWRPDAHQWSVAQCFEHLVTANDLMLQSARDALEHPPASIWQRVPLVPALFGGMLIRSQAPATTRKFVAPPKARPAMSDLPVDLVARFAAQQRDMAAWMTMTIDDHRARRINMRSPSIRVAYSVLDGCRLIIAHDHRHIEQARRILSRPEFPRS